MSIDALRDQSRQPPPPHSWSADIRSLLRVGKIPLAWLGFTLGMLALTVGVIVLAHTLGVRHHGDPNKLFGEERLATYYSVGLLAAAGMVCVRGRSRVRAPEMRRFWLVAGIVLCFTAIDDLARLHEAIDNGVHKLFGWDKNHPVTDHLDDVLVICYVIPAAWLGWRHRRDLLRHRLMVQTMALAFLCFSAMVLLDWHSVPKWIEESFKLLTGALIVCALLAAEHHTPGTAPE
jgi:hypothetical protein